MNKTINFANKPLSEKGIKKLQLYINKNKDNINKVNVTTSRVIKENNVKITDTSEFSIFDDFVTYLEEQNINILQTLKIVFEFKNKNKCVLEYNEIFYFWKLSFNTQDVLVESLILNLKSILKNSLYKIYKKYQDFIMLTLAISYIVLFNNESNIKHIFLGMLILLIVESILFKNVAYRNNKFLIKNKDSILLNIIFYILGVITPYIINWIIANI